ncbi:MAG: type IV secretion system protein TraC [Thermomicrobiales bacterium]|nr:MAG: type IV secretion system protein TraC [Thermomicrobiales bacterium]
MTAAQRERLDGASNGGSFFGDLIGDLARVPEFVRDLVRFPRQDGSSADQFASWLPYSSYVPDEQIFANRGGLGFMLEVMPQSGANENMVEVLQSLYATCPAYTGIQFNLFASPHIKRLLRQYANQRVEDVDQFDKAKHWGRPARNSNLFRNLARARVTHLMKAAHESMTSGFSYTIRDFRLVVSCTIPGSGADKSKRDELMALREAMRTTLKAANLPSRVCDATDLINWCAVLLNPDRVSQSDAPELNYDNGREIRDQIVDFDTIQEAYPQGLRLYKEEKGATLECRFFSIRSFPERFALWQMGALIGDLMQPALQYNCPFMITMGIQTQDPTTTRQSVSANHIRAQQNAESRMARVMPDTAKKLQDWRAAADQIDVGGALVSMYHQVALFAPPEKMVAAEETAKAVWRARGFELNQDVHMHRQALLACLPMTASRDFFGDLAKMRRVTRKTEANAVHLAPIIGEWRGTRTPTLVFGGRRGQLMSLDLYDNDGNYNFAVIGAPGSGKSVLLDEIAWSYRSVDAQVWILDLGRSMEKLCRKADGMYVEFRPDSGICLNPFSCVSEVRIGPNGPEGGIFEDIDMIKPALAKMCSMRGALDDVQLKALGAVTLKLFREYGQDLTITRVRDEMVKGTIEELGVRDDQRIKDLAVMLNPYTRDGEYGRYFEGRNNVDFSNDFIVIENEELKRKPELHSVVNILLFYQITGLMYLHRDRKKVFMIDELKQQLGSSGSDDPIIASAVEEAARRARKYGGALGTATQSADDYYGSAQMEAALNCSDWVFLLRQKAESIGLLRQRGRLAIDDGKARLLGSLRTEPGAFSEVFISSPVGEGIGRLILDPAAHLTFSNKLEDNAPIDALRNQGYSIDEAIAEVLRTRGIKT